MKPKIPNTGKILITLLMAILGLSVNQASGQLIYLSTIPPYNGGNGSSMITFNIHANKVIKIKEMYCSFSSATNQTTLIWYKTDSINSTPSVSASSGWIQAHSYTHTPAVSGNGTMVIISDTTLNIEIPAGATYGFAITGSSVRYTGTGSTPVSPWVIGDSNIYISMGGNVGYGGTITSPIAYRQYNGKIGYIIVNQQTDAGLDALQSPGDTVCSGLQPVIVTLKNYGPNPMDKVDIEWSVNNVAQPTYTWTGNLGVNATIAATIGDYLFNTGTTYDITAFTHNPNNVADTVNGNDTIVKSGVYVKPSPTVTPSLDTINICAGDSAQINLTLTGTAPWNMVINDGSVNYTLNNITNSSYSAWFTPVSSKTYTIVSLSDATGCVNTSAPEVEVIVHPAPPSVISPIGSAAFCDGDSVVLMASIGLNFTYEWKKDGVLIPGATNYAYTAKLGGGYTAVVTSPNGCSTESAPLTVIVHQLPDVNLGNDTNIAPGASLMLDAGAGYTGYLWSTGATTQTITVDSTGYGLGIVYFWVKVTDNYGCEGIDSIKVNFVHNPGMGELPGIECLRIIPNPSNGQAELRLAGFDPGELLIEIYSLEGELVYKMLHQSAGTPDVVNLYLDKLQDGIYQLKVSGTEGSMTRKLMIMR